MAELIDRRGQIFGRLKVAVRAENGPGGRTRWACVCSCGNDVVVNAYDLACGRTQSCGCLQRERTAAANMERIKHGHARSHGTAKRFTTPEYRSWKAMLERCRNPNAPNYHLYGGRGIGICDRWQSDDGFSNFLADMGLRGKGLTLDRIDNDGNYGPENCRWASAKQQSLSRRSTPEIQKARAENLAKGRRYWPRKSAIVS